MYDALLILHFIGVALGVGASFSMFTLGLATKDLDPTERGKFMLRASVLSKNGAYGLVLLIASGIGFLVERGVGSVFAVGGGAFHAKLTLVLILLGLFGYSQVLVKRARKEGGGPALARLAVLGRAMLAVSILIVILAVFAFH